MNNVGELRQFCKSQMHTDSDNANCIVSKCFVLGISTPVRMTVLAIQERSSFLRSFSATKLKMLCISYVLSLKFSSLFMLVFYFNVIKKATKVYPG